MGCLSPRLVAAEPIKVGETILYDIKKLVKVGEASLVYKGMVEVDQKPLILIVVTTKALNFYDEEQLFLSPDTFYPVMVKRNLNIFGSKEKITEYYDQEKGQIRIVKMKSGAEIEQTLKKTPPVENLYGFIYHFRLNPKLQEENIKLNLPTKDVVMKNLKKRKVTIGKKEYDTILLQSDPKQYSVWFDAAGSNIPVKIDGAVGGTKATMILREVREQRGTK